MKSLQRCIVYLKYLKRLIIICLGNVMVIKLSVKSELLQPYVNNSSENNFVPLIRPLFNLVMKYLSLLLLGLSIPFSLLAQNTPVSYQVRGQIVEKLTGDGVPFATVIIKNDSI